MALRSGPSRKGKKGERRMEEGREREGERTVEQNGGRDGR